MKRLSVCVFKVFLFASLANGDVYIKSLVRADSYILGIRLKSEFIAVTETWIGEHRAVRIEKDKKIIVDLENQKFIIVNIKDETYIEARLPLDMSCIIPDSLCRAFESRKMTGTVNKTDVKKEILEKSCDTYDFTFWSVKADRPNPLKMTVWATKDVPVNLESYNELLENLRIFHNRDKRLQEELRKIEGIQLGNEIVYKQTLAKKKFFEQSIVLSEKKPEEDVYSIPDGFKNKEKLDFHDIVE